MRKKLLYIIVFVLIFLATHIFKLGTDIINPDAVNWHWRSEQFVVGLKSMDWAKTYQHYHPGVTLMWIMGPVVEIIKQFVPGYEIYNENTFLTFHIYSKLTLVAVQLVLTLMTIYLLSRFMAWKKALIVSVLFSFEPFFLANSRLLHLDVLMTLFLFNGLLLAFWGLREFKWWKAAFAGLFISFAFLTKSISIGAVLYILFFTTVYLFVETTVRKKTLFYLPVFLLVFLASTFVFFPAMWTDPAFVITEIFSEGERVGVRDGHGQIILGEYTREAGFEFYPLVLAMKLSPLIWAGLITYVFFLFKGAKRIIKRRFFDSHTLFLAIFYIGYFLVMSYPTKKIDRYMVPMFPFLALIAVNGYEQLKAVLNPRIVYSILGAFISAFIIYPIFSFYPYYFTYNSPFFGSAENANRILAQKPFGVGVPALKNFIFEQYGEYPRLGFYDVKPMRAIYRNSRICDIRICGTSDYDLLVLGINEEIPEKVAESKAVFRHDSSFYINGLEYWKIYVKETESN